MEASDLEHIRQLATAHGLEPTATIEELVDSIVSRTSITGGNDEWVSVLEVVTVAVSEPAWSALVDQTTIPTNTVTGMIAAVDQHKPAIAAATIIEVVLHDIRQTLSSAR